MNNYYELDYEKNYNSKELSAKVSCNNMRLVSKKYTDNQKIIFDNNINYDLCKNEDNIYDIKGMENDILSGLSISKKTCIYKRPEYNNGEWEYQYGISNTFKDQLNSRDLFNFQSKAKTSNKIKNCNNDFKLLGECDKGPFRTYVKTFETDRDNCITGWRK